VARHDVGVQPLGCPGKPVAPRKRAEAWTPTSLWSATSERRRLAPSPPDFPPGGGPDRAAYLLERLKSRAYHRGVRYNVSATTPYVNTIPPERQPDYPGDRQIERRIKSIIRWNAMAFVCLLARLLRDKNIGRYVVPIVPDEARTFGMESLFRESEIVLRLVMPLSLSYDHRLVDGGTAGLFLNEVIDYLQSPGTLMLS